MFDGSCDEMAKGSHIINVVQGQAIYCCESSIYTTLLQVVDYARFPTLHYGKPSTTHCAFGLLDLVHLFKRLVRPLQKPPVNFLHNRFP